MLLGFNCPFVPAVPIKRMCRSDAFPKGLLITLVPTPVSDSQEQGGLEHVERPNIISIEEDKGHSPLTERWNLTFFSGKTRRRDGTRRDTE